MGSEAFVQFPAMAFRSREEFQRYRDSHRDVFDERYRREQALGVAAPSLSTDGICAPCLRVSTFASSTRDGDETADGRRVPHWRLAQSCDCAFGLTSHERALLHLALARAPGSSQTRIGVLGRGERIAARLRTSYDEVSLWPRLLAEGAGTLALPTPPAHHHVILAADELAHIPPLDRALAAIAHGLAPGGLFIATTAFDVEAESSVSYLDTPEEEGVPMLFSRDPAHRLGWDLVPRLRDAGFSDAAGFCYWSEELGYLGPYNMIFLASR